MSGTPRITWMQFAGSTIFATLLSIRFTQEARIIIKVVLNKFRKIPLEDKLTSGQHCHMGLICKSDGKFSFTRTDTS